ncbi:MAG: PilZ domain-containing protein [Candidatus Omnitrophica bacterium]|nr:PilZ domain-containing protein [Candidatus Omnitrophota bacterium]
MTATLSHLEATLSTAERRRFPRVKAGLEVEFRPLTQPEQRPAGSLSRDLSAGGVRLTTSRFLARDSRLVLLFAPRGVGRQLRAVARVIWVRERPFSEFWDCGLEFVEISAEDQGTIAGLVERGAVLS